MVYRSGDFYRICDRSGFKVRASETVREWNGLIVRRQDYEERHPQDFVRGRMDRQMVPDARPEPVDNILGPLTTTTTAAAVAGTTTLSVALSTRMEGGDPIGIVLANGDVHRAVINSVISATSITITAATKLPGAVDSGALIIDYDAIAEADIG